MSQPIPPDADPRMFWNGQYLLEEDPEDPHSYSKAAEEAQRAVGVLSLLQSCVKCTHRYCTRSEMAEAYRESASSEEAFPRVDRQERIQASPLPLRHSLH